MVLSTGKAGASAPCAALSVGVISSYVPSGHRVPPAVNAGLPLLPGGRPNSRRSSARSASGPGATRVTGNGVNNVTATPSTRHSTHPRLYVPNQSISGNQASSSSSTSGQHSHRSSAQSSHHGHHRIKPSNSGASPLVEHSFGVSACSSLHSCHYHDEHSFISPCVKYSLFFFNLLFWVCFFIDFNLSTK